MSTNSSRRYAPNGDKQARYLALAEKRRLEALGILQVQLELLRRLAFSDPATQAERLAELTSWTVEARQAMVVIVRLLAEQEQDLALAQANRRAHSRKAAAARARRAGTDEED